MVTKTDANVKKGNTYYLPRDGNDGTTRSPPSSCRNDFSLMSLPNGVDVFHESVGIPPVPLPTFCKFWRYFTPIHFPHSDLCSLFPAFGRPPQGISSCLGYR